MPGVDKDDSIGGTSGKSAREAACASAAAVIAAIPRRSGCSDECSIVTRAANPQRDVSPHEGPQLFLVWPKFKC